MGYVIQIPFMFHIHFHWLWTIPVCPHNSSFGPNNKLLTSYVNPFMSSAKFNDSFIWNCWVNKNLVVSWFQNCYIASLEHHTDWVNDIVLCCNGKTSKGFCFLCLGYVIIFKLIAHFEMGDDMASQVLKLILINCIIYYYWNLW